MEQLDAKTLKDAASGARFPEPQIEIHAIELRIGCPLCNLTFDYRPSDGAIVINLSDTELFTLPYPAKDHPTRKLHEAIKELHEWMVEQRQRDALAGNASERYTGLLLSYADNRNDKGIVHVPRQSIDLLHDAIDRLKQVLGRTEEGSS